MRLYEKAEQVLWFLHAAVLTQKCSRLVLPDVTLAQVLWGCDRNQWPRNWRKDLFRILASLTLLRWSTGVKCATLFDSLPLLGDGGTILSSVEDLKAKQDANQSTSTGCSRDACTPKCMLWKSGQRHHHFAVDVGDGFLGALKRFETKKDSDGVHFEFKPDLRAQKEEAKQDIDFQCDTPAQVSKAWKEKRIELDLEHSARFRGIVTVPLTAMIFGALAGLTYRQRQLLRALLRELTRVSIRKHSDRQDRAHVYCSGLVPGTKKRQQIACPLLQSDAEYVGFNGNGRQFGRGCGYRLRTWIRRVGYPDPASKRELQRSSRLFLGALTGLTDRFGVIAAGLFQGQWYGLAELIALSGSAEGMAKLSEIALRFYANAEYQQLWRQGIAAGLPTSPEVTDPGPTASALKAQLSQKGIAQNQVASHTGKSRSYISKVLNGTKPLSAELRDQIMGLLSSQETDISAAGPTSE